MFVENGEVLIDTKCEGNKFVLERLGQGSIINYQSFFVNDMMSVNIRPNGTCNILEITSSEMEKLMEEY